MHFVLKRLLFLFVLIIFLVACSTTNTPSKEFESEYIADVDISSDMTESDLIELYGGKIISFKPEAGFAILGFSAEEASLTTLNGKKNDFLNAPEVGAQGHASWASGFSAWAGGFSAWAGGWSAWAGGDVKPELPAENSALWQQIKLKEAHSISKHFGEGVTVAVIDTGIDTSHPMFEGRLTPDSTWKDYIDGDNDPNESSSGLARGHGTAIASIILQVAPKAKIMPIRALDADGLGHTSKIIKAIDWAASNGADVINISLGTYTENKSLERIVEYVSRQGIFIVASAGNDGMEHKSTYPAEWGVFLSPEGINYYLMSIGSINANNNLSSFTNQTGDAHYFAPGEKVYAAYPDNKITSTTGTSFAAPLFSGAIALALSEASRDDRVGSILYGTTTGNLSKRMEDRQLDVYSFIEKVIWFDRVFSQSKNYF